ncbi:MAG: tetratricopeptide repeat protein [Paracoccaceae bacterium]
MSTLRKSLGPYRECLKVDKQLITLHADIRVDGCGELLEDLTINDPEFRDWLADQALLTDTAEVSQTPASHASARPQLFSILENSTGDAGFFSALVSDAILQRLVEAGSIATFEAPCLEPNPSRLTFLLRTNAMRQGKHSGIRIRLEAAETGSVIWTGQRVLQSDDLSQLETVEIRRLMNQAVDAAVERYSRLRPSKSAASHSSALCFRAVSKMFSLGHSELLEAEDMLTKASLLDDRGIYLAWRAYLKVIQYGERVVTDRAAMAEEANMLVAHALEHGPGNSMVLALASYVQSVIFKKYEVGSELAEQSLGVSQINPSAWAFLGIARMHLGAMEDAYQFTSYARKISGHGPQRYQLNMLACQTAMVTGRLVEAMKLAELTVGMAPNYAPPKRYLAALLIDADREQDARQVLSDLKRLETSFSFGQMADPNYPASALRLSPLGERLNSLSQRLS